MSHKKKNIQILISFVVFYFAGIGVLLVQWGQESETETIQSFSSDITQYESVTQKTIDDLSKKSVQELVAEKQKLQARADIFTADGEIKRAKNTYNRIILIDDLITQSLASN